MTRGDRPSAVGWEPRSTSGCSAGKRGRMADPAPDYDIVMRPVFGGLDKISIEAVKKLSDHHWFNRTLSAVNDSLVRIGVFNGEFHWHSHEREDEFFLVLEGKLEIELEGRPSVT